MMDRLVELLAGIIILPVGLTALMREGLFRNAVAPSLAILFPLALVATWPAAHIVLLLRGAHPISSLLSAFRPPASLRKAWRLIRACEHLAGRFCQRRPGAVLAGLLVTLLGASLAVMEYALITSFLDMRLSLWRIMAGWTSGWLSFLFPAPGALGAFEGSQVVALGAFGVSNATALGAALVLRGRDLLFAGAGLLLAARELATARAAPSQVRMAG
jgi:lysylphosphatidylglycerol synthase-like protein